MWSSTSSLPQPATRNTDCCACDRMAHPDTTQTESIGGLLRGILMDVRTLIREEIALARVELSEQAGRARAAAVSFGIAAVALACGGLLLLIALATAIADVFDWPVWA